VSTSETVTVYRTDLGVLLATTPEDALGDEPAVLEAWKRLHRLAQEGDPVAPAAMSHERLREAARMLGRIVSTDAAVMFAARIEMKLNGPEAAMRWIVNGSNPFADQDAGRPWDGKEPAQDWFDAVEAAGTSAPAEPAPKPEPKGKLGRVEVKGFRDLGIVRISETTLAGEPMLHAECGDGSSADFPPSSLHFITWLPEGAVAGSQATLAALTAGTQTCPCGEPKDAFGDCPGALHGCDYHHEGEDDPDGSEEGPF
jgi:hypothetical protein